MTMGSWAILLVSFVDDLSKPMFRRQASAPIRRLYPVTLHLSSLSLVGTAAQQNQSCRSHMTKLQNELLRPWWALRRFT